MIGANVRIGVEKEIKYVQREQSNMLRLEPKVMEPVLEILLSAVNRQNIVEFHPEQNK